MRKTILISLVACSLAVQGLHAQSNDPISLKGCLTFCFGTNGAAALINACERMANTPIPYNPPAWPTPIWPPPGIDTNSPGPGLIYVYIRSLLTPWVRTPGSIELVCDATSYGWVYDNAPVTTVSWFGIQSSTNMVDWREELTLTNYWTVNGTILACWREGKNLATTYARFDSVNGATNFVPVQVSSPQEPVKFFRLTSIQ